MFVSEWHICNIQARWSLRLMELISKMNLQSSGVTVSSSVTVLSSSFLSMSIDSREESPCLADSSLNISSACFIAISFEATIMNIINSIYIWVHRERKDIVRFDERSLSGEAWTFNSAVMASRGSVPKQHA